VLSNVLQGKTFANIMLCQPPRVSECFAGNEVLAEGCGGSRALQESLKPG
jgi:hypothetical protein